VEEITRRLSILLMVAALVMITFGATDGTQAPHVDELVRMEMGRILTFPRIQSQFPAYKDLLDASLAREILCQPWDALIPTADVLYRLAERMVDSPGFPVGRFLDEIEYQAIRTDPVIIALMRRGGMPLGDEDIRQIVEDCCDVLGCEVDEVLPIVDDMYSQVWTQLQSV